MKLENRKNPSEIQSDILYYKSTQDKGGKVYNVQIWHSKRENGNHGRKILSNIDKVQKLINPNSKKQIVQLEEDAYFKDLIESIKHI